MDVSSLLVRDGIVLRHGASSKRQLLNMVSEVAGEVLGIDAVEVLEALLEREALGSTGLGSGVAAPHARLNGLQSVRGIFLRLETPVAYEAMDDRPVDLVFALFAPPRAGAEHLRALAAVSRALRAPELREKLRQAHTVDAVRALFVRDEAATAA
jgi:PTS system nitrogen regulatory IIA component